jgi:FixJ family two-component response regulator
MKLGMSSSPTVYIVDDDADLGQGVAKWLQDAGYVAHAFTSGDEFLIASPQLPPGCVIVDMHMPGMDGLELQSRLIARGCRWPVIMLTGQASDQMVARAMQAGVIAFLEKPVRQAELLAAVMKGQAHLLGKAEMIPDPELARRIARLTRRERQVVSLVLQKKLNKQIGAALGIAETTVKGYRRALMKKLGVTNTTELVVLAIRAGIYEPPKPRVVGDPDREGQ